jgi:hypothetical protein
MKRVLGLVLLLSLVAVTIGCRAGGHVDDTGVGAHVEPKK